MHPHFLDVSRSIYIIAVHLNFGKVFFYSVMQTLSTRTGRNGKKTYPLFIKIPL